MNSWYLAVYKHGKVILDAVALTQRGYESTLTDFKIMIEEGADKVVIEHYIDDVMVKHEEIK